MATKPVASKVPPADTAETDDGDASGRRAAARRPAGPSRGRIAANDDAPSIGGLIYALNQKPSNKPFVAAAMASGIWAALGVGFVWVMLGPTIMSGRALAEITNGPGFMTAVATLFGPIALFWFLAMLAWRTEELKLRSTAMTEVAVRLAEPDRMAEQSVASLGQAVRRQVSFMNDAVSRALGRAGELEALVHNEVTSLERSYEDNERKIRSLIDELAGERNALLTTGDRVSETLRSLGSEVPGLIENLANQQIKLARIIEGAGQNLTQLETAMATQTNNLETALGTRTQQLQIVLTSGAQNLQTVLGSNSDQLNSVIESYTTALGGALGHRSDQMEKMLSSYMQSIDGTIGSRTDTLQTVFEEYARALDTTLANRAQALDMQLIERTKTLDNAFSERLRLFDESILRSTMAIDGAVGERANALTSAMESHARNMSETIGKKATELDETLMHGINAVRRTSENITKQSIKAIEGLAGQSDLLKNVSENLLGQIHGVTNRFENQGQAIMKAANALETANYKIDVTLQNRQIELSQTLDRMGNKAEDLSRFMQGYSTTLEGSLTDAEQRARQITSELTSSAQAHSRSTISEIERLKQDASIQADRALDDLRSKFSNVSQEVTQQLGSLTDQFTATSSQMRDRTAAVTSEFEAEQERMRAQMQTLPITSRENTEAMRRALGDQLRALEQLSTLTNREAGRRDVSPPVEPPSPGPTSLGSMPYPMPGRDGARNLSTLGTSLAQELGQRQTPPPAAPSPMPIGAPPQAAGDNRSAWSLGDLLARASHEDEPSSRLAVQPRLPAPAMAPAQQHTVASQGAGLNVDVISRALDPATASAIWSRYRAGQRGVMVRSIYTNEGRVAFDEVSRRFRSDLDFQQTVNRYLADYDRILTDSDRRDQSGRLTLNQITSDTGRVYLFLAHVSGRLG
ncbi:MAG: hypothetical protein ABL904_06290 [Hyphomicrobiaceae bacterium]